MPVFHVATRRFYLFIDLYLLKDQNVNQAFRIKVANKFQILQDLQEDAEDSVESVEQVWEAAKKSWKESCKEELGIVKNQSQTWISKQSLDKIEERKKLKARVNTSKTRDQKKNCLLYTSPSPRD